MAYQVFLFAWFWKVKSPFLLQVIECLKDQGASDDQFVQELFYSSVTWCRRKMEEASQVFFHLVKTTKHTMYGTENLS